MAGPLEGGLDYVVLVVDDLDASVEFYTEVLGLPLGHRAADYAQLQTGSTRLGLFRREAMSATLGYDVGRAAPRGGGFEIGFRVHDVVHVYGDLVARGAEPVAPPTERHWGQRTAYLRDPDGHLIELVEDLR